MSGDLQERLLATDQGARALAAARLRHEVLRVLNRALRSAGLSQADLAKRLNLRRSAVNQVFRGDGNIRVNTLAEYLSMLGFESHLELRPLGTARQLALADTPGTPEERKFRVIDGGREEAVRLSPEVPALGMTYSFTQFDEERMSLGR